MLVGASLAVRAIEDVGPEDADPARHDVALLELFQGDEAWAELDQGEFTILPVLA